MKTAVPQRDAICPRSFSCAGSLAEFVIVLGLLLAVRVECRSESNQVKSTITEKPKEQLPDVFRYMKDDVLPIGNASYQIRDKSGRAIRMARFYRLSELANAPHIYLIWPIAQLERNPQPIRSVPNFVFAVAPNEGLPSEASSYKLSARLMSEDLLNLRACKEAIKEQDRDFLAAHKVNPDDVRILPFPVLHGFVLFSIGGKQVAMAQTDVLASTPESAQFWVDLTPDQLRRFDAAISRGALEMTWFFQYRGTGPVLKGDATASLTSQNQISISQQLSAEQRSGEIPVLDQTERDQIAEKVLAQLRISAKANHPDAILYLNVDTLLPKLFEHWVIQGNELDSFLADPAKRSALADYLRVRELKMEAQRAQNNTDTKSTTTTSTSNEAAGGSFSVPLLGLSFGGSGGTTEQSVKNLSEAAGVIFQTRTNKTEYMPTTIKTYRARNLSGLTDMVISREIYLTKGEQTGYVQDSSVSIQPGQDLFAMLEKESRVEREKQEKRERARQLLERLKNKRDAAWQELKAKVDYNWMTGIEVSFNPPHGIEKPVVHLDPGNPGFRIEWNHPLDRFIGVDNYFTLIPVDSVIAQFTESKNSDGSKGNIGPSGATTISIWGTEAAIVTFGGKKYHLIITEWGTKARDKAELASRFSVKVWGEGEIYPSSPAPTWKALSSIEELMNESEEKWAKDF